MTLQTCLFGRCCCLVWSLVGGKRRWYWGGLRRWGVVGALLAPISGLANQEALQALSTLPASSLSAPVVGGPAAYAIESSSGLAPTAENTAPAWWPWTENEGLAKPPEVEPYRVPTMLGDELNFKAKPAPLVKAIAIDADEVFNRVLACFPERSKYHIDVNLRAAVRTSPTLDVEDVSGLGDSYVGIVANMPLYSSNELDRQKEREYNRRKDTAKAVADFVSSIAARNHAVRSVALYRSLEARAAIRVQQGIVEATEQVGYMEKVANAQKELVDQEAKIMETRLMLAGMCDPVNAKRMGSWLKHVSVAPKHDR